MIYYIIAFLIILFLFVFVVGLNTIFKSCMKHFKTKQEEEQEEQELNANQAQSCALEMGRKQLFHEINQSVRLGYTSIDILDERLSKKLIEELEEKGYSVNKIGYTSFYRISWEDEKCLMH